MNLNQAKRIAGIAPLESITGRASVQEAIRRCVLAIVEARRNGNDTLAAEISEAKEVFRRRLHRNICTVCAVPIGRGATRCRLHQRPAALPATKSDALLNSRKGNGNARLDVSPKGGLIARFGFYAKPVKVVFKKWQRKLGEDRARGCFVEVAHGVLHTKQISLKLMPRAHWQCALELGAALAGVMADRTKAEGWLLNHIHVLQVADGATGFSSWGQITAQAGGKFSARALRKAAGALQLSTPKNKAQSFRRAVAPK